MWRMLTDLVEWILGREPTMRELLEDMRVDAVQELAAKERAYQEAAVAYERAQHLVRGLNQRLEALP